MAKRSQNTSQQDIQFDHCTSLLAQRAQMFELITIVAPKIKAEWESLAYSMRYTVQEVSGLKKDSVDIGQCCVNLLGNWITTGHSPYPKTYQTLLKYIKKINNLTPASEAIEKELIETLYDTDSPLVEVFDDTDSPLVEVFDDTDSPPVEAFDPSCWTKGEFLDGGAIGKVYLFHDKDSNCQLAVKEVEIVPCTSQKDVQSLETEIEILKKLKHERIVLYYGTSRTDKYIRIFMEYMTRGSVYSRLRSNGAFTETLTKKYTKQILEGIDYLHSKKIVHRDMKGANVLINSNEDVKIADFGISKELETIHQSSTGSSTNTFIGTVLWMAPEVISKKLYGAVGPKTDIWSIGCTVVEMLTCYPPLGKMASPTAIFTIVNDPVSYDLPPQCSEHVHSFLKMCLSKDIEARATASDLLKHAFVNQDA